VSASSNKLMFAVAESPQFSSHTGLHPGGPRLVVTMVSQQIDRCVQGVWLTVLVRDFGF
jgi:hypothetical protein